MKLVRNLVLSCLAVTALALPALAGEPGKTLQPLYSPPTPKPPPVVTYQYSAPQTQTYYTYTTTTTTQSDVRNQAETQRIINTPAPQPRVVYRQVQPAQQPQIVQQRYVTSVPQVQTCPTYAPAPTYRQTTTYSYQSAPNCTVSAPQPAPVQTIARPCAVPTCQVSAPPPRPVQVAPRPCAVPYAQTGYVQQQTYATTCPVYAEPAAIQVSTCDGKIIEKMKDTRDGRKRYAVCYADLTHMSEVERNLILLERMEIAAEKACDERSSALYTIRAQRACEAEAVEAAVYDAHLPGLVDAWYSKTGKAQPKVTVGQPIYR